MSRTSRSLRVHALLLSAASAAVIAGSGPALAGVSYQDVGTTLPDNWPASPTLGTMPVIVSGNGGNQGSPSSATVNGFNDNETLGPTDEEAETFTPSENFTLGAMSFIFSGAPQPGMDLSLHLFQLQNTTGASGGYILQSAEVGPDLLGGGSGLPFQFFGQAEAVTEFDFTNSGTTDQVPLVAGTTYALEVWDDVNGTQLFVSRTPPGDQTYAGGQNLADVSGEDDSQESFSPELRSQVTPSATDLLFAVYPAGAVTAANGVWVPTGGGSWTTPANWTNNLVPNAIGASADFDISITANSTVTLDAGETVGAVTFNNTNSYTLAPGSGGVLTLNNGGVTATATVINSAGNHVISAPIVMASTGSFVVTNATGTLTLSGNISGSTFMSGGAGVVVLGGTNTWGGGGTQLAGGTLRLASNSALPTGSPVNVQTAATLDLNGHNATVTTLFGDGIIDDVAGGGTSVFTSGGSNSTSTFSGFIVNTTGSVAVNYAGTGTLDLAPRVRGSFVSNTFTGGLTVSSGTVVLGNTLALPAGSAVVNNGTLSVESGTGSAVVAGKVSGAGLLQVGNAADGNGGVLQLASSSGADTLGNLTVASGSTLDITNNRLVINYGSAANDPRAALAADLSSGFNGGNWQGLGINSSTAAAAPTKFAVGYIDGNVAGDALGKTAAANQLKIAYTLAGDAFLEGTVGFDDLIAVAQNFGKTGQDWAGGNFNYDPHGSVGFADLISVAQNFGASLGISQGESGGGLSPAWQSAQGQVPEPVTTIWLAAVAGAGLLGRRRSTSRLRPRQIGA